MELRRSFRDFIVVLIANKINLPLIKEMLEEFKFGRLEVLDEDKNAIEAIKSFTPNLIVTSRNIKLFNGAQLLTAARKDKVLAGTPFIVLGDKADTRPGGMGEQVEKLAKAKFVGGSPIKQDQLNQAVIDLMDPLIDPNKEEAYKFFDEAMEKTKAGKKEEAIADFRACLALEPKNLDANNNLAALLAETGQADEAEKAYLDALSVSGYSMKSYFGLADIYERSGKYEMAVDILTQALDVAQKIKMSDQGKSRINFYIGEFELRLKRLKKAKDSFDTAIEQNPEDTGLRVDIGDAYADKGYYAESEEHYKAALDMDPSMAHVFNRLGIAYRKQGKYEKALELYCSAQKHCKEDEHLLFNIARAHYEANQYSEAAALLHRALELQPKFKAAKSLLAKLSSKRKVIDLDG